MTSPPVCMTSTSARVPPQRRRSLGPVSPKRIYRNLSVRLRGRDTPTEGEGSEGTHHHSKAAATYSSLWEAVEGGDVLAVQTQLFKHRVSDGAERGGQEERDGVEERERAVNSVNEQDLVPLDVAILTHNSSLLQVLIKAGARHNPNLSKPCDWSAKLDRLVSLAERMVEDKREGLKAQEAGLLPETDTRRELRLWTHRQELYTSMRERFHLTEPPGPPRAAVLHMLTDTALSVSITPPQYTASLITKYRVEWSTCAGFTPLTGCGIITDPQNLVFHMTGLSIGVQYYVRVSACNIKGWGPPCNSSPPSAAPSSWRQCSSVKLRGNSQEAAMKKLLEQIREPTYRGYCTETSRQLGSTKRISVSRGLKQFFHSATKFVRLLQRGAYLAAVFYQKDHVLVTAEGQLPLVEVQCCSTSIVQDFLWFAKLSCAWQQVSWLQQAMSSSLSSSSSLLQNRHSVLRAVGQLQSSLGSDDLGQVYFEPLKDRHGNVLLVTMREVVTSLTPADPHLHWSPLKHLETRWSRTHLLPEPTAVDTLSQQLKRKLEYHRRSLQRAQPGLYVGILKLCSSVEQLRVLVPQRLPNMLLHTRIRNSTHVSREEWSWLQRHSMDITDGSPGGGDTGLIDCSGVKEFARDLRTAVTQLLTKLNIPLYRAYQYRLYTQELVQVGDEMSLLLLLPPSEEFSSSFWPVEGVQDPRLTMPLHIFELVHFWAYSRELLSLYCQAWVRLELDAYLAQQALREALDSREVSESRERLAHITQLSQSVEAVWRERRWIMDVMQCVRSRQHLGAVPLHLILGSQPTKLPHEEGGGNQPEERSQPHISSTGGAVSSSDTCAHTGVTAPMDIPRISDITESEGTHPRTDTQLSPPSNSTCTAISQSIPETYHHGNDPCNHSSSTFHHSGNGIHHIHSCPELSVFPSSSLSISEEEDEDEQQDLGEVMESFQSLNLQEEKMELVSDLESVHSANAVRDRDLESAHSPNAVRDSDLETVHCANAVRDSDLETVHSANAVRDSDLETVHSANAVRERDLETESVHSANAVRKSDLETVRDTDLETESVHSANAVRDSDLETESVHSANAVRDSDLETESVHSANAVRDSDLETVHSANAVRERDLETESVHSANAVRKSDLETVRDTDLETESVHSANAVRDSDLETESVHSANAVRDSDLETESVHSANAVRDSDLETESVHSANAVRDSDLETVRDADLETVHCANAVRDSDLEKVRDTDLETESVHSANAIRKSDLETVRDTDLETKSVHSANAVRDADLETVHSANAVRDADLETELVHSANTVIDLDLESVHSANAVRDRDLETFHSANAVGDTDLETVHCANAVRDSDLETESVHSANAVGDSDSDLETVHCANAVRDSDPDLETVHSANAVRDSDLETESVHSANAVGDSDSDLETVHSANAVRGSDIDLEKVHCANAVRDTVLERVCCANVVGDTEPKSVLEVSVCVKASARETAEPQVTTRIHELETVHCDCNAVINTDLESDHYSNTAHDTVLESAHCPNAVRHSDLESAHCPNAVRHSDLESAHCPNAVRHSDLESAHCPNAVRHSDLESAHCANAVRHSDLESAHCPNAVRHSDLESAYCPNAVRHSDLESAHCPNAVRHSDLESAHCPNAVRHSDLESAHCANAVRHSDLESAHCPNAVRHSDLESAHCPNAVRHSDLESAHCPNAVRHSDLESAHCPNAVRHSDLESAHCPNAVRHSDLESAHCPNAVRHSDLESAYCPNADTSTDLDLDNCSNVDRDSNPESAICAHLDKDTDLGSVHCPNVVMNTDPESVYCTNPVRTTDLESVHCANAGRNADQEWDNCAYLITGADLESVHCANAARDSDPEYVLCAHGTDLESVLEVSVCVRTMERAAVLPQVTALRSSRPARGLVEWVTSSSSQKD